MLTGSLPFPGRTPAQLAKQHTLSEPNLNQLSEEDRPIVRKALGKSPGDRFSSCREFIFALRSIGQTEAESSKLPRLGKDLQPFDQRDNDDTKSVSLLDTKHLEDPVICRATQVLSDVKNTIDLSAPSNEKRPTGKSLGFPRVDSTIEDIDTPELKDSMPHGAIPTLFVGVGGMGIRMLRAIRNQANALNPHAGNSMAWLAIDTERETLKAPCDGEHEDCLSSEEKLHIPLRRPNQYREESQALLQWVSRRWLYNIPRSLQTRGFRPLGRIAIVDHADEVFSTLQQRLHWLSTTTCTPADAPRPIRVVILAGMSGGTGGGTIIDLAQAVRSICQEHSQETVIHGVLGSTFHNGSTDSLAAANMYSLLTELTHTQLHGNCGESSPPGLASRYELPQRPFDEIYVIRIPTRSDRTNCDFAMQSIADYLLLESSGTIGLGMDAMRKMPEDSADPTLMCSFSCVNIGQLANSSISIHQQQLINAIVERWKKQGEVNKDNHARHFGDYANSQFAHAVFAHFPVVIDSSNEATDEIENAKRDKTRSEKIKCIANAFLQFIESCGSENTNDQPLLDSPEVLSASNCVVSMVCMILKSNELQEDEVVQRLSDGLSDQVKQILANSSVANPAQVATGALSLLDGGPLRCGFQRRTMLIAPSNQQNIALLDAFIERCPTLSCYRTTVADSHLLREGSHLHPLHLGARLAESYPDIDEAGGRLHTRSDITWHDLRSL